MCERVCDGCLVLIRSVKECVMVPSVDKMCERVCDGSLVLIRCERERVCDGCLVLISIYLSIYIFNIGVTLHSCFNYCCQAKKQKHNY